MADIKGVISRLWRKIRLSDLLLPFIVVGAIVVPVNLLHVARIATISPIDELMHIDYVVRASQPGFQRMSDKFSQEAMHEIACRRHPTDPLPPCDVRPYVAEDFYWKGRNVASSHSPWYYQATGLTARALRLLLPGDSTVTWARVLGSAWLMSGLGLTMATAKRLGLRPWAVAPVLALVALSPSVQHASTTVNPDATAVFAGGLVAFCTLRALDRSLPSWALALAAFVAFSLDPGNLLAVLGAALLTLAVVQRETFRRSIAVLAALGIGVVVAYKMQGALLNWLGSVDYSGSPQERLFKVERLTGSMLWGENTLFAMIPPTKGYVFPALNTPAHGVLVAIASTLTTAGLVVGSFHRGRSRAVEMASRAGLVTLLVSAPLLVAMNYHLSHWYFPIPARYGLSVLPLTVVAVADTLGATRVGRIGLWVTVGALGASVAVALG